MHNGVKIAAGLTVTCIALAGCTTTKRPATVSERETGVVVGGKDGVIEQLSCTDRTPIKISLGEVDCKASGCQSGGARASGGLAALLQMAGVPNFEGIGDGLGEMFTGAIQGTNCFRVFDRRAMEAIRREQAMDGQQIALEGSDYLIMGSITSINFENKSRSFGGGFLPVVGAVGSSTQTATLGMDVRLVDAKTGEVISSRAYHTESGKTSYGIGGFGAAGGVGFGGAMSGLSGTAMEEVARDIVVRASYDIARELVPVEKIQITR
ncbi:CsgG/HfaB family protein [Desulfurivibrio sp. D14AmB]|uniref:CsgG/HfaB family protein n=1 Tax=Desulfurivibrio sp. D14AmB TaxID=3374370 RepID=UPI00376ECA07